jgi:hypothetical protein
MDLKNPLFLYIGIPGLVAFCLILFFAVRKRKKAYAGGKKAANTEFIKSQKEFQKRKNELVALETLFFGSMAAMILCGLILAARPFKTHSEGGSVKKRDIFLSMDVSYSLYELNSDVIEALKNVVNGMNGERFGVVIFNTSAVTYVPMTDDYDFVVQRLDELKPYFEAQKTYMDNYDTYGNYDSYDFNYDEYSTLSQTLDYYGAGTLTNNIYKGSSLIGEGLATTLYSFPKYNEDRSRVIILCTDNAEEALVPPDIELDGAAKKCKKKNVRVYGICSETQYNEDYHGPGYSEEKFQELKTACESTNGEAYLVTEDNTVPDIIKSIEAEEAKAVKIQNFVHDVEYPEVPAIVMLFCMIIMIASGIVLKR